VCAVALSAAVLLAVPLPTLATSAGAIHLPNLKVWKPGAIRVRYDGAGNRLLRFTTSIPNAGLGPFELRPEHDDVAGTTTAYQRVYTHDADWAWSVITEYPVGTFVFHPQHAHWHFEGFAEYRLHDVAADGSIGSLLREPADKVSFCMLDSVTANQRLAHASPTRTYTSCDQDLTQGISVGWADRYPWWLAGQWIDVTGLPDGTYWLVIEVDPLGRITETRETDNMSAAKIQIIGDSVTVLASATSAT
jgi:hypothetical protein